MHSIRGFLAAATAMLALAAVTPSEGGAQSGISVWAGAGGSSQGGTATVGKDAKQLGVQFDLPFSPIAIRGDALLFGSKLDTDALSYSVNAVFQMSLPVVQPYGIVGRGKYAISPGTKESGWNYGAGVRVGLSRFGVFGEVRRHDAVDRTVTVVGLTF